MMNPLCRISAPMNHQCRNPSPMNHICVMIIVSDYFLVNVNSIEAMDGPIIEKLTPIETNISYQRIYSSTSKVQQRMLATSRRTPAVMTSHPAPAQISLILPKNTCFINWLIFKSRTVTKINIKKLNDNIGLWNPHICCMPTMRNLTYAWEYILLNKI